MTDTVTVYPELSGMAKVALDRMMKERLRRRLYQRAYRKRVAEKKNGNERLKPDHSSMGTGWRSVDRYSPCKGRIPWNWWSHQMLLEGGFTSKGLSSTRLLRSRIREQCVLRSFRLCANREH